MGNCVSPIRLINANITKELNNRKHHKNQIDNNNKLESDELIHQHDWNDIRYDENGKRFIGNYELGQTLGDGRTAKVKVVRNTVTNEMFAMKILKDEKYIHAVLTEIQIMHHLNHLNIIKLIDYSIETRYPKKNGKILEKCSIIILELAEGGELFNFLAMTGKFDEDIARSYFHQLIDGIECCHEHNVAHRDLKPENIMFDNKFNLKIADFGFGHGYKEGDFLQTECGTRSYMAPEITLSSQGYSGFAVDIFATGVILFIMIAGFPPFRRANNADWWYHKISTKNYNLFWQAHLRSASFTIELRDLIIQMFDPDPNTRISISKIKEHSWYKLPIKSHKELNMSFSERRAQIIEKQKEQPAIDGVEGYKLYDRQASQLPRSLTDSKALSMLPTAPPLPPPNQFSLTLLNTFFVDLHSYDALTGLQEIVPSIFPYAKYHIQEDKFKIKVYIPATSDTSPVDLNIQIYTADHTNEKEEEKKLDICAIMIRRVKGDPLDFNRFFQMLQFQITGVEIEPRVGTMMKNLEEFEDNDISSSNMYS